MAFISASLVASRLTLHRSCSVCRTCVWPWKDERCTWPFPCPPADTNTQRKKKTLIFYMNTVVFIESQDLYLCLCSDIWECVWAFSFLFDFPLENLCKASVCVCVCVCVCRDHLQTQHSPCEKRWCRLYLLSPLWWLTCCALWCRCPSPCNTHTHTHTHTHTQTETHTHKNASKGVSFPTQQN